MIVPGTRATIPFVPPLVHGRNGAEQAPQIKSPGVRASNERFFCDQVGSGLNAMGRGRRCGMSGCGHGHRPWIVMGRVPSRIDARFLFGRSAPLASPIENSAGRAPGVFTLAGRTSSMLG